MRTKTVFKVSRQKNSLVFSALCIFCAGLAVVSCIIGVSDISPSTALRVLADKLLFINSAATGADEGTEYIIMNIRLPRVLFALVAGSGLSVCGLAFQAIFRNPLSDPYVLGVSSGASFGAALAIILGLESSLFGLSGLSFLSAFATVTVIIKIASYGNRIHTTTLLLAGISINFLISAIISLMLILNQEQMDKIIFWTMGSLSYVTYGNVLTAFVAVMLGTGVVAFNARPLNAMLIDSQSATTLGVNVERTKRAILLVCTLMVAVIVAYSGVIGFIGLVVPHMVRLCMGSDNRRLIPYSIVGGMIFMLASDLLSRMLIPPSEIPVGSITALIGSPFFIFLLFNAKKRLNK